MKKIGLKSIKSKLITVSVLILTIPLIVLGLFSYTNSANSLDEIGSTNLRNSVEFTIELIDSFNEQVENGYLSLEEAQERVKVAILGEMDSNGERPINRNIDLGEKGYIFITDTEGISVAHPNIEGQNSWDQVDSTGNYFVQEFIDVGMTGGGFTYYDWPLPNTDNQIEEKVVYSKADPHWGWVVSGSTYLLDFNQPANDILTVNIIVIAVALVIGLAIIWLFASSISKPIVNVTEQMNWLAQGDLTREDLIVKSKDETGVLAESINSLKSGLRDLISNIANTSETLSAHSEELSQSANEVKYGTEQVSATMEELASGSENQANSATNLSETMQAFQGDISVLNENADQVVKQSNDVLGITNEGRQLMEQSRLQMRKINDIVKESVEKVNGLDGETKEISSLVSVIQDIADQTNLLALNAAIEAARAGEHGKGFAVVADEVRKLAEQVSSSIADITNIVTNIQSESSSVTESLQEGYAEVESGTAQIEETGGKFVEINNAVTDMVENMGQVSNKLLTIVQSTDEMNQSVENIASISEEAAAGVEETSATTQQTSSSMEEVAKSSDELARLAEELNNLVRQTKL